MVFPYKLRRKFPMICNELNIAKYKGDQLHSMVKYMLPIDL